MNVLDKIKNRIWELNHKFIVQKNRIKFSGKQPTIISCNCIGGILYHDLGLSFTSPTINLWMTTPDFITFCENLKYYLSLPFVHDSQKSLEQGYPVAALGDITLYLMHYPSVEEAEKKWNERKSRMNMENIFVIACDRDNYTPDILPRFNALPYKKKIFTHIPVNSPDCFVISGNETDKEISRLTDYSGWKGLRIIDQFDWVSWLSDTNT